MERESRRNAECPVGVDLMLVDTSAWIEWLRATGSRPDRILTSAFERGEPVSVTGIVVQEVLQGGGGAVQLAELRQLLATCQWSEPVPRMRYSPSKVRSPTPCEVPRILTVPTSPARRWER